MSTVIMGSAAWVLLFIAGLGLVELINDCSRFR